MANVSVTEQVLKIRSKKKQAVSLEQPSLSLSDYNRRAGIARYKSLITDAVVVFAFLLCFAAIIGILFYNVSLREESREMVHISMDANGTSIKDLTIKKIYTKEVKVSLY